MGRRCWKSLKLWAVAEEKSHCKFEYLHANWIIQEGWENNSYSKRRLGRTTIERLIGEVDKWIYVNPTKTMRLDRAIKSKKKLYIEEVEGWHTKEELWLGVSIEEAPMRKRHWMR